MHKLLSRDLLIILRNKKKKQNKVGAHGMGGVGKTTIACALVEDEDIRKSFDRIVWVSVGQEPDLRELQDSIHFQLQASGLPENAKAQRDIMQALRNEAPPSLLLPAAGRARRQVLLTLEEEAPRAQT